MMCSTNLFANWYKALTERLSLLHDKFRKRREGDFKIDYDFIKLQGISSMDYIAPSSIRFDNKYFVIEDEYYKTFYLTNLPANLADNFLRNVVETNFPVTVTLNIKPIGTVYQFATLYYYCCKLVLGT